MGLIGLTLAMIGGAPLADGALIALWGLVFGAVPVGWSTWLTRMVPDEAETGGGLIVAAVQLAIAAGAAAGGVIFDARGATGVFTAGGLVLLLATVIVLAAVQPKAIEATA
jgi:predicted MFS family arabinose efflux permease